MQNILTLLTLLSMVVISSQAQFWTINSKTDVVRPSTVYLYKELFDDVLPANLISVPSSNNLTEFKAKLEKIEIRDAKENSLNAYQRANLKFWLGTISNQVVKCDPQFDDKLLTRYQQHAFRVLPPDTGDNVYWEFEHLVGLIRNKYLMLCEKKLVQLINGTSIDQIHSIRDQLKREPNIENPIDDALKLVMSHARKFCKGRTSCFGWMRRRRPDRTVPEKYGQTYADTIVNPCMRIASSRWMGKGIMDYLLRFKQLNMLNDQVKDWYKYTEWCHNFVDPETKSDMWEDVFGRLAEEDACLVWCLNDRD